MVTRLTTPEAVPSASPGESASSDMIVAMVAVSLGVIFVFAFLLLRLTVVRPLHRLIATAKEILGGTLDRKVEGVERRDEVGDIARVGEQAGRALAASGPAGHPEDEHGGDDHGDADQDAENRQPATAAVHDESDDGRVHDEAGGPAGRRPAHARTLAEPVRRHGHA